MKNLNTQNIKISNILFENMCIYAYVYIYIYIYIYMEIMFNPRCIIVVATII